MEFTWKKDVYDTLKIGEYRPFIEGDKIKVIKTIYFKPDEAEESYILSLEKKSGFILAAKKGMILTYGYRMGRKHLEFYSPPEKLAGTNFKTSLVHLQLSEIEEFSNAFKRI